IAELDVDIDVRAVDADLLDRLAGDEVLAGIGIDERAKAGLDVRLGNGHLLLSRKGTKVLNSTKSARRRNSDRFALLESTFSLSRTRSSFDVRVARQPTRTTPVRHDGAAVRERPVPHRPHHGVHPGRHLGALPADDGPRGALRLRR